MAINDSDDYRTIENRLKILLNHEKLQIYLQFLSLFHIILTELILFDKFSCELNICHYKQKPLYIYLFYLILFIVHVFHSDYEPKSLGCFKAKNGKVTPLHELILIDRDNTSRHASGKTILWQNWDFYIQDFASRCADEAVKRGYKVIGLQFYGECWSSSTATPEMFTSSFASTSCTGKFYKTCAPGEKSYCVGQGHANFVYHLIKVPPRWEVIFDFEKGSASLAQWKQTGTAFKNQPTYGDNPTARNRSEPSKHQGNFWIGGAENRPNKTSKAGEKQGDEPQGTLTSPSFFLNGNKLRFLIGGGCDITIERVELIVDGRAVKSATGKCSESMAVHEWIVSCFIGKEARIRLVDSSSGVWAHINFDHFEIWTDKKHLSDWCPLFDFEKGRASLANWTLTGTVFNNQPTYGDNPTARGRKEPSNHQGDWWIGGAENRPSKTSKAGETQGDKPFGSATSPTFVIKGNKMRFLIGGGCNINFERVELLVDGMVVKKATSRKCTEHMAIQEWNAGVYKGKKAQVRLVDKYKVDNIWAHINFDQFEVYQ